MITMKRIILIVAIATAALPVKAQDVNEDVLSQRASAFNLLENLSGTVAGASVLSTSGRPGGNPMMMIRGIGSINGDTAPLYVVDGISGADPSLLNAADIESVSILKDGAATALYGVRGANGVVIITTKSGKRAEDGALITYDMKIGTAFLSRKPWNKMNAAEYLENIRTGSGITPPHLENPVESLFDYLKLDSGAYILNMSGFLQAEPLYDTDWWKESTRNAVIQSHNLSLSQSKGGTDLYAAAGWQDYQGIIDNTGARRFSGLLNASGKISSRISVRGMVSYSRTSENRPDYEGSEFGAIGALYYTPAIIPVKHPDGTWGRADDYPLASTPAANPVHQLSSLENSFITDSFLGSLAADFQILKDLTLTVSGNCSDINYKNAKFSPEGMYYWSDDTKGNCAYIDYGSHVTLSTEDYLSYSFRSNDGRIQSSNMLGTAFYKMRNSLNSVGSEMMSTDLFSHYNLSAGTQRVMPMSDYDEFTLNSFYLRSDNVFLGRYMLALSLRLDGSSAFEEARSKYGVFPAVSAGWLVSEEPWFESLRQTVGNLKLRASYGKSGNMSGLAGVWEDSSQLDAGLDLCLFSGKIRLSADLYGKHTECYPSSLGSIDNKGYEITLKAAPLAGRSFSWNSGLTFSSNKFDTDIAGADIADFLPKGELSFVNSFAWKGFTLMIDAAAAWGFKIDDITMHPGTRNPEDGTFVRVRNILLGYDLKPGLFKNVKAIKGIRAGVSAENLLLFTGYSGYDPEAAYGTTPGGLGKDSFSYPRPAYLTANFTITF